jgi:hypothetical protein
MSPVASALAVALFFALYAVGTNIALSTGAIARLISSSPEKLRIEFGPARSFWPGRVHVTALDIRSRSAGIEWQLHIDSADADISLLELLRHRFRVHAVTATGVSFRLRFRLEPDAINLDRADRMPPIAGFPSVPIVGSPPESKSEGGKPWTVDIQRIDAQNVREVWIDAYRVLGALRAKGGFTLAGDGLFTLAGSSADVANVTLGTGDDTIAANVGGTIAAQLDTVNLQDPMGVRILRYLTVQSTLSGATGDIRFIRHFVPDKSLLFAGGAGTFGGDANVLHGLVMTGTRSHIELGPATVAVAKRVVEGTLHFDFGSDNDEQTAIDDPSLAVTVSDVSLYDSTDARPSASCKLLSTHATTTPIDLSDPDAVATNVSYTWGAPQIFVHDLRVVDATIPADSPFHIVGGGATLSSTGRGSMRRASTETEIDSHVAMKIRQVAASAGVRGKVLLKADFVAGTLDLAGTALTLSDPASTEWWGTVDLTTGTIHVVPASISLGASASASDAGPFLTFYAGAPERSPVAIATHALLRSPVVESMTRNLRGSLHLGASKGVVDLKGLDFRGDGSRLRALLKKHGETLDGGILVETGPAALGVSFEGTSTRIVAIDASRWFETSVSPVVR